MPKKIKFLLFLVIILLSLSFLNFNNITLAQENIQEYLIDYVFLIDATGSMEGFPQWSGNAIIFPKVKKRINEFLEDMEIGSNILIYTFTEGVNDKWKYFTIKTMDDIIEAQNYINNLAVIRHTQTWIYYSLNECIDKVKEFRSEDSKEHIVIIYLFTDGKDNSPGKYSMKDIIDKFEGMKEEFDSRWDSLYYYSLGVKIPEKDKEIIDSSKSAEYSEEEKGSLDDLILIQPRYLNLDYGNIFDKGKSTRVERFNIKGKKALLSKYSNFKVIVNPEFPTLKKGVVVEVIPNNFFPDEQIELTIELINKESLNKEDYGEFQGTFNLLPNYKNIPVMPNKIEVSFTYEDAPNVTISPYINEKFPYNLGEIIEPKEFSKKIFLDYNNSAIRRESRLNLYSSIDDKYSHSISGKFKNKKGQEISKILPSIKEIEFILKVEPKELKPGNYQGAIVFSSKELNINGEGLRSDPNKPKEKFIDWVFYIPEPMVFLSRADGDEFPYDFGLLKEEDVITKKIILKYNEQAKNIGGSLKISINTSSKNPSTLFFGENLIINNQENNFVKVSPPTEEVEFKIKINPEELEPGDYSGTLTFSSEDLTISSDDLMDSPNNPEIKYTTWNFAIPKPPPPPWLIILYGIIGLIILLIVIYLIYLVYTGRSFSLSGLKSTKCVIPDETYLYIRNLGNGKREQINISGKKEVIIGKDGQYLNDIEERMILRAIREDGKNLVRLTVESGKVTLIKAGSMKEEIVIDQTIFNRDVIKFGNYQIRVSSFYLERDIN